MMDNEKRKAEAEVLEFMIKYFDEGKKRGLTPKQIEASIVRAWDSAKSSIVKERRDALRVVPPEKAKGK
jgi:hypothetical protein